MEHFEQNPRLDPRKKYLRCRGINEFTTKTIGRRLLSNWTPIDRIRCWHLVLHGIFLHQHLQLDPNVSSVSPLSLSRNQIVG